MQGTLYGVRLARAGHTVTLVARGRRAAELRDRGAIIEHVISSRTDTMNLPVVEEIAADMHADLCFVTVRREQLDGVLPTIANAHGIGRVVFMVNHANGSMPLFAALEKRRVVLAFPGAAGSVESGVDRYIEVAEQPTVIEATAPDIARILRGAGFSVKLVRDMDSWLRRHAVFVTAVSGAIYEVDGDSRRVASDKDRVRNLILAIREGWAALDRRGIAAAPIGLRAIFQWVTLPFAVMYWRHLLGSPLGEYYFARHARHAATEMAVLVADVCALLPNDGMRHLRQLYVAVERAAESSP